MDCLATRWNGHAIRIGDLAASLSRSTLVASTAPVLNSISEQIVHRHALRVHVNREVALADFRLA